jgi:hypothetical protein
MIIAAIYGIAWGIGMGLATDGVVLLLFKLHLIK